MTNPVIKNAGYILVHTPDMILHNGTTATVEKASNPNSEYISHLSESFRRYEEVVNYAPNQVFIGNQKPETLIDLEMPWHTQKVSGERYGRFGEIMPQEEFIAMIKMADAFDLVRLTDDFTAMVKEKLSESSYFTESEIELLKEGDSKDVIIDILNDHHGEGIFHKGTLVGCVKRAHDLDTNLNAHVMLENLVVKASGVLAVKHLMRQTEVAPEAIEYVIECSEEACGDMNQRGGGNFAKSIAEAMNFVNATGSDTRGFCAGPTHALINAAALVKSGVYKNVVVVGGGATAKLGMNGKDHVKKGMPILEDCLGGFAVLVSEDDGISPVINTNLIGRHTVGTGSSPQAVITSLITQPLDKGGLKITDVDKYSVEMQNPDITKPAGAGDVPESNYKMIAALGVKRGELEKSQLMDFVKTHGMPGFAPTQGHIPSGVPYIGFAVDAIKAGTLNRVMIVGKGSLFLARMTNQFDGVSFVIEANSGISACAEDSGYDEKEVKKLIAEAMRKLAESLTE
ncbi:glycine/sarcosine/betaine reductase complex component C subunit beta [Fusibacter tunisiensis]|uniref:Betaine reductase n=1 Tax=Fusibacter tunisiensis TaxID=1008308 RepID=A0ABS2MQH5_9FIRM|nr:glycine/sarcosine/betaine reductase complex component C subunit beta [Fusibacter tunisiensis]MBM7561648.1 betaine reductase [Fusibacter tunisiensis]